MGFGGDLLQNCETLQSDFISQSSIDDSDFDVLVKDNLCEIMKDVNSDDFKMVEDSASTRNAISSSQSSIQKLPLGIPKYDPNISYDAEYYELFEKNMELLEEIDRESNDIFDIQKRILRIKDFYDHNILRLTRERDQNGRKIHKRKTMAELERDIACPYDGCNKVYASEGSLNLHIKRKHNGGNKTDREKIAKSLLFYKAKGYKVQE